MIGERTIPYKTTKNRMGESRMVDWIHRRRFGDGRADRINAEWGRIVSLSIFCAVFSVGMEEPLQPIQSL